MPVASRTLATLLAVTTALCLPVGASGQEMQIRQQVQRPPQGPPGTPSRDASPQREGTGSIKGRVFANDSSTPLRRARVSISSPENRLVNRSATTDNEGRFEFKKLPKGRYNLTAQKGGYVTLSYGQRRPFERGRPVELAEGQALEQVNFTLPRGCVITGRVVDDLGDPVADVMVSAMRLQYWQGKRTPQPMGRMATTDDIGQFRLHGLPPGEYIVGTVFSAAGGMMGGDAEDGFVYAPTYYPGTGNVAEAGRVAVRVGQQRSGLDFVMISSRTATLSGTAFNAKGQPAIGASVMLGQTIGGPSSSVMMRMGGTSASVQPDGSFRLSGVAPGEYDLSMNLNNAETGEEESASTHVVVNGVDIAGISLFVTPGARATGVVVTDAGTPPSSSAGQDLRVQTVRADGQMSMGRMRSSFGSGLLRSDGSFELKGIDGSCLFRVSGLHAGWALKQVLYDGRDITDTPLEFRGTEDVSGLQLVVTNQVTTVTGQVTDDRGTPVKEYTLVVFPEDSARWTGQSRYLATARPDQNGQFRLEKLPPADYLAIALDYLEDGDSGDPEFLNRVRDLATRFTLGEAESKTLSLKLVKID